jgi:molybdopterin converting factor small subunit
MSKFNRGDMKKSKNEKSTERMIIKDCTGRPTNCTDNTTNKINGHVLDFRCGKKYDGQQIKEYVRVSVLYFAQARVAADGVSSDMITFPRDRINKDQILSIIFKEHPQLNFLSRIIQLSVNCKVLSNMETLTLSEEDQIALLPPIAGG